MILYTIYNYWLLKLVFDNARHLFKQFVSPGLAQKIMSSFYCKHTVEIDL
ncbi:MAG: hypothetical protein ACJA08_003102 [Cyclobacteriaceae bacterium]|jgi:hypothetical protein